jgi:hypothetical protein
MQNPQETSHQQQGNHATISFFLLDHDGCLGSLNVSDGADAFFIPKTGDMAILNSNQENTVVENIIDFQETAFCNKNGLAYYIQQQTKSAGQITLCVGSNRTSSAQDYENRIAKRREEEGAAHYSGSRAPARETLQRFGEFLKGDLVQRKQVHIDKTLLEDIIKTTEQIKNRDNQIKDDITGIEDEKDALNCVSSGFGKKIPPLTPILRKISDFVKEDVATYPFSLGACGETKIPLVYAHMHRQAKESPDKLIDVYFIDDREDILQGVEDFFYHNFDLMPSNVCLKTARYAPFGNNPTRVCQDRQTIQGEGQVNTNIEATFDEMDAKLKVVPKEWRSEQEEWKSALTAPNFFTKQYKGFPDVKSWFWEKMREEHIQPATLLTPSPSSQLKPAETAYPAPASFNPFSSVKKEIPYKDPDTELRNLVENTTPPPSPSSPPKNEKPTSSPRSGTPAVSARLASSPSPVASKKRRAVLKGQKVQNSGYVEQLIDHVVNKSGEWSPFFVSLNFMVFSTLKDVLHLDANVDMALGKSWNILNGVFTLLLGITQLSDEREHRRVTRKLKGLTNVASGTQLLTLTAMNFSMYGGPALAASFGISFLHSLEGLYHRVRLMNDKAYWLRDVQSQLEGINEEITRLNAMPKMSVGFFSNKGYIEKTKHALEQRKQKLEFYIKNYNPGNKDWPLGALDECKIELVKAMMNTTALGLACAAMVTACISPHTALPIIILTSAMFLLKNAATFAAEKTFFNEDASNSPAPSSAR